MKRKRRARTLVIRDGRQRKALASPIRLEILGQFTAGDPMSVAEIAARMGRPSTAIYYHVHQLEEVGLLARAGTRSGTKRDETLYQPVADQFDLTPDRGNREHIRDATTALSAAHRMATRDMQAALECGDARTDGPARNLIATRMHGRLSPKTLKRVNAHLDALLELFLEISSPEEDPDAEFCSLTFALMPLRGRRRNETP
jgi:DNA-binding transcriptional ArsR family regulator